MIRNLIHKVEAQPESFCRNMIKMDIFYDIIFYYDTKYCYNNIAVIIAFIIVYLREL